MPRHRRHPPARHTRTQPAALFDQIEKGCLLAVPAPYDQPILARVKVARDYHVQIGKALYSAPMHLRGSYLDARADSHLVKLYTAGHLVKTHPRQDPGKRSTDPADLPESRSGYPLRDLTHLIATCADAGPAIGEYAERLLDHDLPWTRMRAVYRLQGLIRRYGPDPVNTACAKALHYQVISVPKIAAMLEAALETNPITNPAAATTGGRFARHPTEFTTATGTQLHLLPGGHTPQEDPS